MKRFALLVLVLMTFTTVFVDAAKDVPQRPKASEKTPANFGNASVNNVIAVEDDFTFRCNIKDWPEIIARDIPVKIRDIAPPAIVIKEGTPNTFFQTQAKKLIEKHFANAKNIELRNVARGKTFSLVADVFIDDKSLAESLIEEGIARKLKPGEQYPPDIKESRNKKEPASNLKKYPAPAKARTFTYLASKSSKIFHKSTCRSAKVISDSNRVSFTSRQQAVSTGRKPCKICNP